MKIDLRPMGPRELDCLETSSRRDDADARALEQAGQDAAVRRAVVHDQRGELFAWRKPGIKRWTGTVDIRRSAPAVLRRGNQRKREEEPAPFTWDAFDLQFASHLPDQVIADGETQTRAAGGGARLRLYECFENRPEGLGFDADARVADLEDERPLLLRAIASCTSPVGVNLMALPSRLRSTCRRCRPSSTTHRGTSVPDRHRHPEALPVRRFGDNIREVGDELREIGRAFFDVQPSCLDLREVEHVVDQLQ